MIHLIKRQPKHDDQADAIVPTFEVDPDDGFPQPLTEADYAARDKAAMEAACVLPVVETRTPPLLLSQGTVKALFPRSTAMERHGDDDDGVANSSDVEMRPMISGPPSNPRPPLSWPVARPPPSSSRRSPSVTSSSNSNHSTDSPPPRLIRDAVLRGNSSSDEASSAEEDAAVIAARRLRARNLRRNHAQRMTLRAQLLRQLGGLEADEAESHLLGLAATQLHQQNRGRDPGRPYDVQRVLPTDDML